MSRTENGFIVAEVGKLQDFLDFLEDRFESLVSNRMEPDRMDVDRID